jgi:hypothetical protein
MFSTFYFLLQYIVQRIFVLPCTYIGQRNLDKSLKFSSLLYTVTSTALSNSGNLLQFLQVSSIKPYPLSFGLKIHTETSSLRTLKIMPRNLNENVHEFGFSTLYTLQYFFLPRFAKNYHSHLFLVSYLLFVL